MIIVLLVSCSKSSDPGTGSGGCSFTFKGKTYTSTVVSCGAGNQSSSSGSSATGWVLSIETSGKYIGLQITDGPYDNDNATLTKSGNTVTFNVKVENVSGDSQTINGKCTCSLGSL